MYIIIIALIELNDDKNNIENNNELRKDIESEIRSNPIHNKKDCIGPSVHNIGSNPKYGVVPNLEYGHQHHNTP